MNRIMIMACLVAVPVFRLKSQVAPAKYRIDFTSKPAGLYSLQRPAEFLSERAIQRRIRQGIPLQENDLPVNPVWIDSLVRLGFTVLSRSRWFNSVVVFCPDTHLLDTLKHLAFVKSYQKILCPVIIKQSPSAKFDDEEKLTLNDENNPAEGNSFYGWSYPQVALHNGQYLHQLGYTGTGMHIALLDGNFNGAERYPAFHRLRENRRILATYDFVERDRNVYDGYSHGMSVLSVIAGYIKDTLIGTGYDASFYLLRTEDESSEYRIEEENWIAAAEYADSAGVDIINSSLGYSVFTDPLQNYSYADMNGSVARISLACSTAFAKGIFVCTSAGNEGNKPWHYITAPADAIDVYSVGATDKEGNYVFFSSAGPSSDGRIKPDGAAMGLNVCNQKSNGTVGFGSGTSFSSPLIAGSVACLWQKHPDAKAYTIRNALLQSSSNYYYPGTLLGYGIPDFKKADEILSIGENHSLNRNHPVAVYPNPFNNYMMIGFYLPDSAIRVRFFDLHGRNVYQTEFLSGLHSLVVVDPPSTLHEGLYIVEVKSARYFEKLRIIKKR